MEPSLQDGYLSAAAVFLVSYVLSLWVAKLVSTRPLRASVLFIWHTIFAILYAAYTLSTVADAKMYFREGGICTAGLAPGTDFVILLSCMLQTVFGNYYLPVALFSGSIGGVGLIIFDAALRQAAQGGSQNTRLIAKFLPFLPSISFWSAGLGKDSLAFLAAALFCLTIFDVRKRLLLMVLSIVIMGAVRPHIAALQFIALIVTFLVAGKMSLLKRSMVALACITIAVTLVPYVLNYVGFRDALNLESLQNFVEERQSYNLEGGSSVDISSQHPLERIFTLLFRPTILDARNAQYIISGMENLLLLLLFVLTVFSIFRQRYPINVKYWITGVAYSSLGIVVLSQTIANLGIATRQKWMVILPLLVIAIAIRKTRTTFQSREHLQARPVERFGG